ncbi:Protein Ycf2 [Bienertia sinuspersici]
MLMGGGSVYGLKSIRSKKKNLNINLIVIIDIINFRRTTPDPINEITFSRKYETSKSYK